MRRRFCGLLSLCLLVLLGCETEAPLPNLAPALAKAAQCVAPTAEIRRYHGAYLNVHRDEAVVEGIRASDYSLTACLACHVDPVRADGTPVRYDDKQQDHFCASCHRYVGVNIDCFQCHADRPAVRAQPDYQHKLSQAAHHWTAETNSIVDERDLRWLSAGEVHE